MELQRFKSIGVLMLTLLSGGTVSAVDDCCSETVVSDEFGVQTFKGLLCSRVWSRHHRTDGKICLPLGTGYACGVQRSLVVGQSYTLSGSVTVGGSGAGATAGISTTITVQEQTTHTAGPCQSCQFFASYGNAAVVKWTVEEFCVWGDSTYTRTLFYNFGGAPTIQPCCEVNNSCPGCDGDDHEYEFPGLGHTPFPTESASGTGEEAGGGPLPQLTLVVDLREPFHFNAPGLPAWHPMNAPGVTIATLNGWQTRHIMGQVNFASSIDGVPVTELAIIDADGTPLTFDLIDDPRGLVPCPADMNDDGLLDLTDLSLFVNYFLFGDDVVDLDGNTILDLADLIAFTDQFLAGCP